MADACCGPAEAPIAAGPEREGADHTAPVVREALTPWWRDAGVLIPAASGVFLMVGAGVSALGFPVAALVIQAVSLALGAWTFIPGALRKLWRGHLTVGLLMTIAAVGAVLLGHVAEAAALAFLFSLAEALEDRAMDRARHGLGALLDLIPTEVRVLRDGHERVVAGADVRIGDVLLVAAGERVATDGIVTAGRGGVDLSAITGESIPVSVAPGDPIAAGAINGSASLRITATADGRNNSLTDIVALVSAAQDRKGEWARRADRIARPLVPAVLILSALVVIFGFLVGDPGFWTERALVVLVAASPCALAIAVPVTVISAIGSASRFGVIVKSGAAFERLGAVRRVVFDKTGTLTRNVPEVVAVESADAGSSDAALIAAAALEMRSTHPLARAIVAAVPTGQLPVAQDVTEEAGRGLAGLVDGVRVRVGSARWLLDAEGDGGLVSAAERLASVGMTVVVIELDGRASTVIGIRDELRPEAGETVATLRAQGIEVALLTGDSARTAEALAHTAGIAEVHHEQLPTDKARVIEQYRRTATTAMIGDGINDAPALATADVGIAMGQTGSAAALESADIAFVGTDLRQLPRAIAHARRGLRIMTGNIVLALAIIVVLVPLALWGVLGLAGVVLVHEVAEVIVILNGVRAARIPRRMVGS
ncbi:heavy metal translocating P-type ATPase [Mycetocola lacteus]